MMVYSNVSLTEKTRPVIILQPVANPYLHSLGRNSNLQNYNALPHRAGFITDYLLNLGVQRPVRSPDLKPTEHFLFVPE